MKTAADLAKELDQKRNELKAHFDKHRDASGGLKMDDSAIREARRRNDELTELSKQFDAARDIESIEQQNADALKAAGNPLRPPFGGGGAGPDSNGDRRAQGMKSLGEQLVESAAYKSFRPGTGSRISFGIDAPYVGFRDVVNTEAMKATLDTAGSGFTSYDRQPGMVLLGQQRLTIADLLSRGETTQPVIRYAQEDTFTNAATTVAEGATKPEATWDTSEQDAPVRKIAVTSKVTDEMFADFPAIRDYINARMPFMVKQREEAQLLLGSGVAPNITGLLNTSGVQTQARGTDSSADAIYKALVKVRVVGYFEPDGVVLHPDNWTPIRLLKTTDGAYVWGHPSEAGPERIWGVAVVTTTAITLNTGLVGSFRLGAQVFFRSGVTIEATNSNEDDFKKNLIALRAEERLALAVYRPKAFCSVTALS